MGDEWLDVQHCLNTAQMGPWWSGTIDGFHCYKYSSYFNCGHLYNNDEKIIKNINIQSC